MKKGQQIEGRVPAYEGVHKKRLNEAKKKLSEGEVELWLSRIISRKFDIEGSVTKKEGGNGKRKKGREEMIKDFLANRTLLIEAEKRLNESKEKDVSIERMWVGNYDKALNRSLDIIKRDLLNDLIADKIAFFKTQDVKEEKGNIVKDELEHFHRIIFNFAIAVEEDLVRKRSEALAEERERGRISRVLARYGKLPRWKRLLINGTIAGGIGASIGFWGGAGLAVAATVGGTRFARSIFGGSVAAGLNTLSDYYFGWKYGKRRTTERKKTESASLEKMQGNIEEWLDDENKKLDLMEGLDKDVRELRGSTEKIFRRERKMRLIAAIGSGVIGGLSSWALSDNFEALISGIRRSATLPTGAPSGIVRQELPFAPPAVAGGVLEATDGSDFVQEWFDKNHELLGKVLESSPDSLVDSSEMQALGYVPDNPESLATVTSNLQKALEIKEASGGVIDISEVSANPEILDKAEYVKGVIGDFKAAQVDLENLNDFINITDPAAVKEKLIAGITEHFNGLTSEQDKIGYLTALGGNQDLSEYNLPGILARLKNTLRFTPENMKVEIKKGDSIWRIVEKKFALAEERLAGRYQVPKFGDLATGRQDYLVDWLKDDILAHPEKYGLADVKNLHHLSIEQLKNFADSQGLADIFNEQDKVSGIFTKVAELTEAQVKAIETHRELLTQVRAVAPKISLTSSYGGEMGIADKIIHFWETHPGMKIGDITKAEQVQNMLWQTEVAQKLTGLGTTAEAVAGKVIEVKADDLMHFADWHEMHDQVVTFRDAGEAAYSVSITQAEGQSVLNIADKATGATLVSQEMPAGSPIPTNYQATEIVTRQLAGQEKVVGEWAKAFKDLNVSPGVPRSLAVDVLHGQGAGYKISETVTATLKTVEGKVQMVSEAKNCLTELPFSETVAGPDKLAEASSHINNLVTNNTVLEAAKQNEVLRDIWPKAVGASTKVSDLDKLDGTAITRLVRLGDRPAWHALRDYVKAAAKASAQDLTKNPTVKRVLETALNKTADGSVKIPAFKK